MEKNQNKRWKEKEHDYDKWIKMSEKIREDDVTGKAQTEDIAKFLKQVLRPHPTVNPKIVVFELRERSPL